MPDPINTGCNRMPPINISAKPPANSQEEITVYGCAPKNSKAPQLTEGQARLEVTKRCTALGLSNTTTKTLLKSLKLGGFGSAAAGPNAQKGLQMLATLQGAVKRNPKLSSLDRDQYATLWMKLKKRTGAQQAWTRLGRQPHFWNRMSAKHRRVAAYQLANSKLPPKLVEKGITRIAGHHLFASANSVGRHNALADPCDSAKLLNANTLPDVATQKRQAPALMKKHLGHMQPASRAILHQQVMAKARYLSKAFFEYKPGSSSKQLWGDRFVNANGRDWYKQCLNMILTHSARSACRSTFKMLGAHKGADLVCGKD